MSNHRKIVLTCCLLFLSLTTSSQCWNARDEAVKQVSEYYQNSNFDLISTKLSEWASECEMNEELFRLSILNAVQHGKPIDSLLNENTIGFLRSYETQKKESLLPHFHSPSFASLSKSDELLSLTQAWAQKLKTEDDLTDIILSLYSGKDASTTWKIFFDSAFPHRETQESFNRLVSESGPESFLSIALGGFYHLNSQTPAPQLGFSLDNFKHDNYRGFGSYVRLGSKAELELEFKEAQDKIASNSIHFFYNHGKRFKTSNVNYLLFGTAANTLFISEYTDLEVRKRMVAAFHLGVGGGMYFAKKRPNKIGVEIRYLPINLVTNKDVDMNVTSLSINLKYMILDSRVAREFLGPIGYYKR
ncbi:MAG: hypothetical protein HRT61_18415 [Ekhidna sp.]|nr:hypothetical protein [Ekhidna sp.]